jgi:hypothetical protein
MSEIKTLCINTLISFGISCEIAKAVVSELLYESTKMNSDSSPTYSTVFEVLGKFSKSEVETIQNTFQSIQDDEDDTDAILFVIDLFKRYCLKH